MIRISSLSVSYTQPEGKLLLVAFHPIFPSKDILTYNIDFLGDNLFGVIRNPLSFPNLLIRIDPLNEREHTFETRLEPEEGVRK